jgi:anti-anti-sigma regulatory factor
MGLLEASPSVVACEGELVGGACDDFAVALYLLKRSDVDAPIVDLTKVSYISRRGISLLVALWSDMDDQGRRLELLASGRVWDVLGRVGVAHVFPMGPDEAPSAGTGRVGARRLSGAIRREAQ